jgi:hypothetical protein
LVLLLVKLLLVMLAGKTGDGGEYVDEVCFDRREARRWSRKTWKSMMAKMVRSAWPRLSNGREDAMMKAKG